MKYLKEFLYLESNKMSEVNNKYIKTITTIHDEICGAFKNDFICVTTVVSNLLKDSSTNLNVAFCAST